MQRDSVFSRNKLSLKIPSEQPAAIKGFEESAFEKPVKRLNWWHSPPPIEFGAGAIQDLAFANSNGDTDPSPGNLRFDGRGMAPAFDPMWQQSWYHVNRRQHLYERNFVEPESEIADICLESNRGTWAPRPEQHTIQITRPPRKAEVNAWK